MFIISNECINKTVPNTVSNSLHKRPHGYVQITIINDIDDVIFGWCDKFDLQVPTPNGKREVHIMAHQFPTLKEKMKIQVNEAYCLMPKENEPHSFEHSNGMN